MINWGCYFTLVQLLLSHYCACPIDESRTFSIWPTETPPYLSDPPPNPPIKLIHHYAIIQKLCRLHFGWNARKCFPLNWFDRFFRTFFPSPPLLLRSLLCIKCHHNTESPLSSNWFEIYWSVLHFIHETMLIWVL